MERAVKTIVQILYDMGFFNQFDNADEIKYYLMIAVEELLSGFSCKKN